MTPLEGGQITVRVDSFGTGHAWPSGAAQDRRTWLELVVYDAAGAVIFQSGVVPDGMDPEEIGDPNLFGFWDRTFKADGTPSHFFWDVARIDSQLLRPPVTLDKSDPAFDHSTTKVFPTAARTTSRGSPRGSGSVRCPSACCAISSRPEISILRSRFGCRR